MVFKKRPYRKENGGNVREREALDAFLSLGLPTAKRPTAAPLPASPKPREGRR